MRPAEVIDQHRQLKYLLAPGSIYRSVIQEHAKLQVYDNASLHRDLRSDDNKGAQQAASQMLLDVAVRATDAAYTFKVEPDMVSLVEYAASQLDSTDTWDRSLAPTGCGLVRFDRPLRVTDVRGNLELVHWLLWGPAILPEGWDDDETKEYFGAVTGIWAFNDAATEMDHYSEEILTSADDVQSGLSAKIAPFRRFMPTGMMLNKDGGTLGDPWIPPNDAYAAKILADGSTPTPATNMSRLVHALWLLFDQTIVAKERVEADRATAKRARRMGIPTGVTVIQLRRTAGATREPGETMVEWSHRWVVRGFWRNQPYGPGRKEYKRIWIAPFIKGPANKPLVITDKLYDLSR